MAMEASEVAVRVRLLGGSAFEREAQGVARSVEEIGAAGKKANEGLNKTGGIGPALVTSGDHVEKFGKKMDKLGGTMMNVGRALLPASMAIAGLGYYAVKAQSQFQSSMTLLATQAGLPRKNLQGLTKDILALSTAVGQTPTALAQGAFPIVSSGFHDPKKAAGLLRLAGVMASVGHDTVDNTATALMSIINTGFKPKGGASQIAAWLESTVGQGMMHLPDLTQALNSSILPIVKMTGMSLPQILAAGAALTRQGVNPSTVFSRMRLSLTSVESPTKAGITAMAHLGLSPFALANDLKTPGGLLTMLQDLKTHAALRGGQHPLNYIAEIFGKSRGISNIGALLDALPQMNKIYGNVTGATPALLQQHFAWSRQTTAFKMQQLRAEYDKAMIDLGQSIQKYLLPAVVKLLPYLSSLVKWFGKLPGPVKEGVILLGALTVVLAPVMIAFGGLFKATGRLIWGVGTTLKWIGRLGTASEVAAGEQGVGGLGNSFKELARGLGRLSLAVGAAYLAFKAFGFFSSELQHPKAAARQGVQRYLHGDSPFRVPMGGGGLWPHSNPNSFLGRLANALDPHIGFHIPGLATGGMVQSPGLSWVGERGPELMSLPRGATVTPLPTSGLSELKAAFGDGTGAINLTVNTLLDGKIIATSVANINRKQQNRR